MLGPTGVGVLHHRDCCQPTMRRLDIAATARASAYLYNTREEIDALAHGLNKVQTVFRREFARV